MRYLGSPVGVAIGNEMTMDIFTLCVGSADTILANRSKILILINNQIKFI